MVNTNKIKGRMRELGLTQHDLSKRMGTSLATVNRKINNVQGLNLDEAEKLSVILGISDIEFRDYFFAS